MKNYLLLPFYLLTIIFLLASCSTEIEISGSIGGPDEEDEETSTILHEISADLGTLGNIDFEYNECDINESNSTGTLTVGGVTYEKTTLKTRLRRGGFTLLIQPVFLVDQSTNDDWEDILDTDLNDQTNPNFGLEVEVQRNSKNYTSTSTSSSNGQFSFVYTDGFTYNLTHDKDYDSECNEDELFELSGNISGLLTNSNTDGTTDSIEINIPDFSLLYIPK